MRYSEGQVFDCELAGSIESQWANMRTRGRLGQ